MNEKQQAHDLIERLAPSQISAVVHLLRKYERAVSLLRQVLAAIQLQHEARTGQP